MATGSESHTFNLTSVETCPMTLVLMPVCDHEVPELAPPDNWACGVVPLFTSQLAFLKSTFPGKITVDAPHTVEALREAAIKEETSDGNQLWWGKVIAEMDRRWTEAGSPQDTYYYGVAREQVPGSIGGAAANVNAAAGRERWVQGKTEASGGGTADAAAFKWPTRPGTTSSSFTSAPPRRDASPPHRQTASTTATPITPRPSCPSPASTWPRGR